MVPWHNPPPKPTVSLPSFSAALRWVLWAPAALPVPGGSCLLPLGCGPCAPPSALSPPYLPLASSPGCSPPAPVIEGGHCCQQSGAREQAWSRPGARGVFTISSPECGDQTAGTDQPSGPGLVQGVRAVWGLPANVLRGQWCRMCGRRPGHPGRQLRTQGAPCHSQGQDSWYPFTGGGGGGSLGVLRPCIQAPGTLGFEAEPV